MDIHQQPFHRKYYACHHEHSSHRLPDQNTADTTAYLISDHIGARIHRDIYSRLQYHRFLHTGHLRYYRAVHEDTEYTDCTVDSGSDHRSSDGAELQDGECELRRSVGNDSGVTYSDTVCCIDSGIRFPAAMMQP